MKTMHKFLAVVISAALAAGLLAAVSYTHLRRRFWKSDGQNARSCVKLISGIVPPSCHAQYNTCLLYTSPDVHGLLTSCR